jgi:hypothetical protein
MLLSAVWPKAQKAEVPAYDKTVRPRLGLYGQQCLKGNESSLNVYVVDGSTAFGPTKSDPDTSAFALEVDPIL